MNNLFNKIKQIIGSKSKNSSESRKRLLRAEKKRITGILTRFMKDYKQMRKRGTLGSQVEMLLIEVRSFLDDSAKTAMAIDKGYSLRKIAKAAKKEKYNDLARVLCLAA